MVTIRSTKKLLDRMRIAPAAVPSRSTTVLGDWYANLLYVNGRQLILCVSEKTLLPVLIEARDAKSFPERLPNAVAQMLHALGIDGEVSHREIGEMFPVEIGKTASKVVLGSMNDFAWLIEVPLERGESLIETSLFLCECPCKPLGMSNPKDATMKAFALH